MGTHLGVLQFEQWGATLLQASLRAPWSARTWAGVVRQAARAGGPPERVYAEVKSSSSSDKTTFELGVQEVELARAEGNR